MQKALYLVMLALMDYVLVASLCSPCAGVHGSLAASTAEARPSDAWGAAPLLPSRMQIGIASWYGKAFQGRLTASGERYDMAQLTAAHRTAPLGTHAVVTNIANGYAVRVRINDRGPHMRHRLLDLSYAAAQQLAMVRMGIARVQVEFLETSSPLAQRSGILEVATSTCPRVPPTFPTLGTHSCVIQGGTGQDQRQGFWV
jgi:rare lipoprotein A